MLHQKANYRAMSATAKAMIKLLALVNRERRGFLGMEWAAGNVFLAALFQRHARADHVDNIGAGNQVINKGLGNAASHGFYFGVSVTIH